jgi:thioesterase domain-containing protein
MFPNRAVGYYNGWMMRAFAVTPGDCILQKAPASFDACIWEFFLPLIAGARMVLARPGGQQDPEYLMSTIAQHGVNIMQLVPSQLQMVLDTSHAAALKNLRLLALGGEALPGDLLARLDAAAPMRVVNLYGPTECTVYAMAWHHDARSEPTWDGRAVPIGSPTHNAQIHIVAPGTLELQPVGVAGEIVIGGVQVARGYQSQPGLTAEKFVADPFTAAAGARLYRTGDLGVWRASGTADYLGRIDNQIKLRGFRIELGEIEEVLQRHPAVAQGVVVVREDTPGEKRLAAYVAFNAGQKEDWSALRQFLRASLPEYMVPLIFVALPAIPLNANGKADRGAILAMPAPTLSDSGLNTGSTYAPPRTTIEHELVHIWEQLLTRRPIGIRDDFFAIGGHSLLAVRMLFDIERVRGRRLPVATLFEHSTIEALAAVISSRVLSEEEPASVVLNADAKGIPIVFVHGDVRGGGWYARRLAQSFSDRPMIVLPTIRPEGPHYPATIPAMAARHIAEIQRIRPQGPYAVGGFCAGGLIAYEIAQQMQARGTAVEHLFVIDTAALNAGFQHFEPVLALLGASESSDAGVARRAAIMRAARYYRGRWTHIRRLSVFEQVAWLRRAAWRRVAGRPTNGKGAPPPQARNEHGFTLPAGRDGELDEQLYGANAPGPGADVLLSQQRAALAYIQRPYTGTLHAIWASEEMQGRSLTRGWDLLVSDLRVSQVKSTHIGLITRDLPALAARLASVLGVPKNP